MGDGWRDERQTNPMMLSAATTFLSIQKLLDELGLTGKEPNVGLLNQGVHWMDRGPTCRDVCEVERLITALFAALSDCRSLEKRVNLYLPTTLYVR